MPISKKVRFEVFKRDNFTCQYCGQTPPTVVLEIDHIKPRSKKGKDDINNLIAACFNCNRGKTNIELKTITPQLSQNLQVLKEREKQLKEYYKLTAKIEKRAQKQIEVLDEYFHYLYDPQLTFTDVFKQGTLKQFLKYLEPEKIAEAMDIAKEKIPQDSERATKYFCGICWNWIKKFQDAKKQINVKNSFPAGMKWAVT